MTQWTRRMATLATPTVPAERPMYSHPCDHPVITADDVLDAAEELGRSDWSIRGEICRSACCLTIPTAVSS